MLALVAVMGCEDRDPGEAHVEALASRLAALEKRIAAVEERAEPLERLRDDAASLDRRLTSLETSVRELASRPAAAPPASGAPVTPPPSRPGPSSGPAAWGPTTRADRTQRRAELRALSDEFRARLAELRSQPGGMQDGEKTREILDWYREQRRAILRGEGRTDQ